MGLQASGLASGLDTQGIIESLTKLESRPLDTLRARQSEMRVRITALGDLTSKLSALEGAAKELGSRGVLTLKVQSTPTAFTASPTTGGVAASHRVEVLSVAAAASARSVAYASAGAKVQGGKLTLTLDGGTPKEITLANGGTLEQAAAAINASGAAVTASVLVAQEGSYLQITRKTTGHTVGADPSVALQLAFAPTETEGTAPGLAITRAASNAKLKVDGLTFERTTNEFADVVPGVTLTAAKLSTAPEDLTLSVDVSATQARLQSFVDAYNAVGAVVQKQLATTSSTDRSTSLGGDSALRGLQQTLQALTSRKIPGQLAVQSLADLGVKTARDGKLSIDGTTFAKAVAKDPAGVNALFSDATSGLDAAMKALVQAQTRSGDGVLTTRKAGLEKTVTSLDAEALKLQARIDGFRQKLVRQFAAMEKLVSTFKSTGDFLSRQEAALDKE